ncbi:hypothetical protein CCP4SC76_5850004 [Gammaproteobacteria bacterium]
MSNAIKAFPIDEGTGRLADPWVYRTALNVVESLSDDGNKQRDFWRGILGVAQ